MTRSERTYYIVVALYSGAGWFMGPVYPLFLLSRGLDLLQMNLVLAAFLICAFLFEVPTGGIADVFGRKVSFLLSCAIRACAFLLYTRADSFADCVVAEVIDALGLTLASGALDAWAVDGMRAEGHEGSVDRIFARAQVITRGLMVVGGIGGGYLASYGFVYAWLAGASLFIAAGLVGAFLMHDDRPAIIAKRELGRRPSVFATIHEGWKTVRRAPVLMVICASTLGLAFAAFPANMLWQARLQELSGQGVWLMGWVWALINLATLAGGWLVPRLLGRAPREQVLAGATLWRAGSLALAAAATAFNPALLGVLMAEMGFGVSEPMIQAWMNDRIPSERRATVLSVRSMFATLGGALGLVSIGYVAREYGIPSAWTASACVFALVAPAFLVFGRRSLMARRPAGVT
jgi:MFS family permease